MIGRTAKTREQLDDESVVNYIRSFVTVQAADWRRRKLNDVLPRVLKMVDAARDNGDSVDLPTLMKQVWVEQDMPSLSKEPAVLLDKA